MTAEILLVLHHESRPLKKNCFGTPFCLYVFLPNTFARLTLHVFVFTFICIRNCARSVSFSDGRFCGRDIIQRSNVSFILALETNRSNRRRTASTHPVNWGCEFFLFLSFFLPFFFLLTDNIFSFFCAKTRKLPKEAERESSPPHSISGLQINVWLRSGC